MLESDKVNWAGRLYPLTPDKIAEEICSVQPIDPEPFRKLYKRVKENERIRNRLSKIFMIPPTRVDPYMIEAYRLGIKESKNKS